jgi:hypothetical protein
MPFYMVKNSSEKVSKGVKSMESKFKFPPLYLICNIQPFLGVFRPNLYFEYLLFYVFKNFVITWRVMLCPKTSMENNVMSSHYIIRHVMSFTLHYE